MSKKSCSPSRDLPEFDRARAGEVVRRLVLALDRPEGLVAEQADLVENQVPSGVLPGSLEHAQFLFLTVPCDRGTKSSALWARARATWEDGSPLFAIRDIAAGRVSLEALTELMAARIRPRYAVPASAYWHSNARRLADVFEGDPRRVFGSSPKATGVYAAIRSFAGFGPKTGGMMLRAAVGLGWASGEDIASVEMPVDVHDARISLQTGIMNIAGRASGEVTPDELARLARPVRRFLTELCANEGVEWPGLDRALWLIGSRGCVSRRCASCPLESLCSVPERLPLFERPAA